jgi:hypothetical protein
VIALSTIGLLVGIAAPSWGSRSAPSSQIGTSRIKNHAVTTKKLAHSSVTSSKVRDGSLTASDVAPNTFLPSDGEAVNSQRLQGHPAGDFVQGTGVMLSNSVSVPDGNSSPTILGLGFGKVVANCNISGVPTLSFTSQQTSSVYQLMVTTITYGGTADLETRNGLIAGTSYTQPNSSGLPQQVTFQVHYVDGSNAGHFATAWVTDQKDTADSQCVFFGQAYTTG